MQSSQCIDSHHHSAKISRDLWVNLSCNHFILQDTTKYLLSCTTLTTDSNQEQESLNNLEQDHWLVSRWWDYYYHSRSSCD